MSQSQPILVLRRIQQKVPSTFTFLCFGRKQHPAILHLKYPGGCPELRSVPVGIPFYGCGGWDDFKLFLDREKLKGGGVQ
jgi:hypothetical protein